MVRCERDIKKYIAHKQITDKIFTNGAFALSYTYNFFTCTNEQKRDLFKTIYISSPYHSLPYHMSYILFGNIPPYLQIASPSAERCPLRSMITNSCARFWKSSIAFSASFATDTLQPSLLAVVASMSICWSSLPKTSNICATDKLQC